jgi:L-prolyl-[peptidyl-carrier protein] dehydrogenase
MDFEFTRAQRERHEEIASAVHEKLSGNADYSPGRSRWAIAAEIGLTGLCLPVECGGKDLGALDTALCLQAFGYACPDTGLAFGIAAHLLACGVPIRDFAAEPARSLWLSRLASGSAVAANAITEEEAGSDISRMATTARKEGGDYVLDGEKSFVSNGPLADLIVTYGISDPAAGHLGVSAFAVPAQLPGVTVSEAYQKMGLHGCQAGWVRFQDCRVPAGYLLGAEGQGSAVFRHSMMWERACLFGIYLGLMDRQLELCVERAKARRQFGRSIGQFQAISHRIARMRQRLEGARLLLYRACWAIDEGCADEMTVGLAKAAVSEASVANSLDSLQVFGAVGYLSGGAEQQLRDCVPSTIFSGTTEIQYELAALEMGL